MSSAPQTRNKPMSGSTQKQSASASAVQADARSRIGDALAWIAKGPNQPMVLETVDLGPLGRRVKKLKRVEKDHCSFSHHCGHHSESVVKRLAEHFLPLLSLGVT
jgi:hypothetical protein